jgi:hypothetical protein
MLVDRVSYALWAVPAAYELLAFHGASRVKKTGEVCSVTTPTAKAVGYSIGVSGHAHADPSRYVPKAPPEPVGSGRGENLSPLILGVSSMEDAASFRSQTVTAGCNSVAPPESAAKILPSDRLFTRTPRIFGCREAFASQTSSHILLWKGGAPDFLCRLKTTVPVR